MAERVKPRRSYHSPRRQQQAAATRQAILEAALRLFEQRGYPATTMEQVAAEAGVALKTVYVAFQTKSGLLRVLRSAAPVDPDAAALWRLIQSDFYDNQRVIVETLHANKALRPGLDVAPATDILWTLNHPDVWLLLVGERGWTPEQWERWFADTACAQLLRLPPAQRRRSRRRSRGEGADGG